ncbi:MAG: toxin-antitoxin system YwqK family antitoxin [Bacteroidales bacterium]|jgi:antitoxin component YwqK of YwqJK toxin-antitoxin module|nr:toxin-antitoxin system YwqK family antitoxin [Bacteroidales bacterium]
MMNNKFRFSYGCIMMVLMLSLSSCTKTKTTYFPNGKLQSVITYKGSKENGLSQYYEEHYGKIELEIEMKSGKKEGKSTRYYLNGEIECASFYKNDLLEGKQLYYTPMGQTTMEINYHQGLREGDYKEWHVPSANVKVSGHYKNDLMSGRWEYFDERDVLVGEGNFTDGTGTLLGYDAHGNLIRKTEYKKGFKDGLETYYDDGGEVSKTILYHQEEIVEINGEKVER